MDYYKVEPFGADRDNWHAASIASVLANAHRDSRRRPNPYTIADFFYVDPETQQQRADNEILTNLRARKRANGKSR